MGVDRIHLTEAKMRSLVIAAVGVFATVKAYPDTTGLPDYDYSTGPAAREGYEYSTGSPDYDYSTGPAVREEYDYSTGSPEYDYSTASPDYDYSTEQPDYDYSTEPAYDYSTGSPDYDYSTGPAAREGYDYSTGAAGTEDYDYSYTTGPPERQAELESRCSDAATVCSKLTKNCGNPAINRMCKKTCGSC